MTADCAHHCRLLLENSFGRAVSLVGSHLICIPSPLSLLVSKLRPKLAPLQVKRALSILIKHNLVTFDKEESGKVWYECQPSDILNLLRVPRLLVEVRSLFGEESEIVIQCFLAHGQLTLSQCQRIFDLSNKEPVTTFSLKSIFGKLAATQFIIRCPNLVESCTDLCPVFEEPKDSFLLAEFSGSVPGQKIKNESENSRKRKLDEDKDSLDPDADIFWRVNFKKYDLYFRDQLVIEMATKVADEDHGKVIRALLRVNELRSASTGLTTSFPIALKDIMDFIKESSKTLSRADVLQHLSYLVDNDLGFVRQSGESGGGIFVVDFEKAITAMCQSHIEMIVKERFDVKGLRIFRLLLDKRYLEQNEIETFAMLPAKEAKDLTYQLLKEEFVSIRELSKTSDFSPISTKTFYIFHVDLESVVQRSIQQCYKNLKNFELRKDFDKIEHHSLLERKKKADLIIEKIQNDSELGQEEKTEHTEEVEATYLSEGDKKILENHAKTVKRIEAAQMELKRSLFIFNLFVMYKLQKADNLSS